MQDMTATVRPLLPALKRYARSMLRDDSAADDLVQDCLERAVSHWDPEQMHNVQSWLFVILHNLAINHWRKAARRGHHIALDDTPESELGAAASQEYRLRHSELVRALEGLVDDQREVLLLISVDGLSYSEAAKVLGCPIGTVMSRVSRARERLRETIEEIPQLGAKSNRAKKCEMQHAF
jgi:RNA polymerase sigma factor (sigma-70 family)